MTSAQYGERKHESCRFGRLTKAIRRDYLSGAETPDLIPLCDWRIPEPAPPAAVRGWGGAVDFDRDCALCIAHAVVDVPA